MSLKYIKIYFLLLIPSLVFGQAIEEGKASYYADKLAGNKTASGEVYSIKKYTASHKTHPFHTLLKVTNKKNSKFVIVRVNDRGPHTEKRIIDLSRKAAEALDIIKAGEAVVTVEVVGKGEPGSDPSQELPDKKSSTQKNSTSEPISNKKQLPDSKTTEYDTEEEFDASEDEEEDETPPAQKTAPKSTSRYTDLEGKSVSPKGTGIQIGAFQELELAKSHGLKAQEIGFPSIALEKATINEATYYRVIIYDFQKDKESNKEAKQVLEKLKKEGMGVYYLYKFKE